MKAEVFPLVNQQNERIVKLQMIKLRSPTVSPHIGSWPSSDIKLPTKAQDADINNVAGIKRLTSHSSAAVQKHAAGRCVCKPLMP
jgi:hypothetical protein